MGQRCGAKADVYSFGGPRLAGSGTLLENLRSPLASSMMFSLHPLLLTRTCVFACLPALSAVVLWEICTGKLPVRGQLRDPK